MKALASLTAALAAVADAHYIFNILIVNDRQIEGEWAYVRRNSNSYNPVFPDIFGSTDLRCNVGARPGGNVKTYNVKVGDKIGFKVFNREVIEHPGPGFVYMSKAPNGTSLNQWDGSGRTWFKAYEVGLCGGNPGRDTDWCTYNKDRIEFVIPQKTPPGDYLVRVEHIGLHEGHVGRAQLYMQCFQLHIDGPGGGNPSPMFEIPGIYKASDPGIAYNKWAPRPANYIMPGPAKWNGS